MVVSIQSPGVLSITKMWGSLQFLVPSYGKKRFTSMNKYKRLFRTTIEEKEKLLDLRNENKNT